MFKCEKCKRQSEPKEKAHKLVVQKRGKAYPNGSVGWEIVKEIIVCGSCVESN